MLIIWVLPNLIIYAKEYFIFAFLQCTEPDDGSCCYEKQNKSFHVENLKQNYFCIS